MHIRREIECDLVQERLYAKHNKKKTSEMVKFAVETLIPVAVASFLLGFLITFWSNIHH